MARPSQKRFHTTLPMFKLTELGGGKLGVQCPRSDCGGKFVVGKNRWRLAREEPTRSCCYCYKVALIRDPNPKEES